MIPDPRKAIARVSLRILNAAAGLLLLATGNFCLAGEASSLSGLRATCSWSGQLASGQLVSASQDRIVMETDGGPLSISAGELPQLTRATAKLDAAPGTAGAKGRVWFREGSTLPFTSIVVSPRGEVQLELALPVSGASATVRTSLDHVASLRLLPEIVGTTDRWQSLRRLQPDRDLIVTPRRDTSSLDYLEGFFEAVDEQTISIVLDDEPISVKRAKVYGVVLSASPQPDLSEWSDAGPRIMAAGGIELRSSRFKLLASKALRVECAAGFSLDLPSVELHSIDYSAGRVAYLSDLSPETSHLRPMFGLPTANDHVTPLPAYRPDQSYWGGPLTIRMQPKDPYLREFAKGLSLRSESDVSYRLDGQYQQFVGVVALSPRTPIGRTLRARLVADGKPIWGAEFTSQTAAVPVSVSVTGAAVLKLSIERVNGFDGTLHLGDARLLR